MEWLDAEACCNMLMAVCQETKAQPNEQLMEQIAQLIRDEGGNKVAYTEFKEVLHRVLNELNKSSKLNQSIETSLRMSDTNPQ